MAADNNHPQEVVAWIEKVIDSCESIPHFSNTRDLIFIFEKALEIDGVRKDGRDFLISSLLHKIWEREVEILNK
jgi:hypothetical protein